MSKKTTRSATPKTIIVVKENPLDKAAAKYIAMFSGNAVSNKKASLQKSKGGIDAL